MGTSVDTVLVTFGLFMLLIALINKPIKIKDFELPTPLEKKSRIIAGMLGLGCLFLAGYSNQEVKVLFNLPQPEKISQNQTFYQVSPLSTWQDTGITLKAGQEFRITASGIVTEGNERIGPQGSSSVESALNAPRPGVAHLVIVGKINDTGTVFVIGNEYRGFAEADGKLFLTVNESPVNLLDNGGSFTVTVEH